MRAALLSNVTIEVLASQLAKDLTVWTPSGFGAWMETALNPPESLRAFNPEAIFFVLHHQRPTGALANQLTDTLTACFPNATIHFVDVEDVLADVENPYDARMWKFASMPWSLAALNALQSEVLSLLNPPIAKKVLALDLDGTLWEGVVGEDGADAIKPFTAFQQELKSLAARGILLVALSKNNPEDVTPVWSRPGMVLQECDFAAASINWNPKSDNLRALSQQLNLALDAVVFLDDNPAERAEMAAKLPEVTVAPFPCSGRLLRRRYFPERPCTREDALRAAGYRADVARQEAQKNLTFEDYLRDLQMQSQMGSALASDVPRLVQLAARSNQFNVLTSRASESDFQRDLSDPARLVWVARLKDRFGDLGLVAFIRLSCNGESAEILDWTMSCRAMNRRFESTVESALENHLLARGIHTLYATWRKTPKNAPVEYLFDTFGFTCLAATPTERRYLKQLGNEISSCQSETPARALTEKE